ncbi:hypothetical protein H0H92_000888 [Tricholoma furcatifolium]|nr:hypothetical protein H0H92_000888 [Tricholoma furcatifolium]
MSLPPVPPRPYSAQGSHPNQSIPPPVPPVPPELRYTDPIPAPRPHRVDPSVPANMARNLEEYPGVNYSPGFVVPQQPRGTTSLPPQGNEWSPFAGNSLANSSTQPPQLSSPGPMASPFAPNQAPSYTYPSPEPIQQPNLQLSAQSAAPSLTAPIPTIATLQPAVPNIQNPNYDPALKIAWARDVFALVDRTVNTSSSTDPPAGPAIIHDPALLRLAQLAVPMVLQIASAAAQPAPPHVAEAIYLRATLAASGAYPEHVQQNLRVAFRDFETAARAGYAAAWFRLGRDYENFNDAPRARDCFERGVKLGVESCAYRMGMAHLMGQLGLRANPATALPLLHRAAILATVATPQPAYIFALLLLGEFASLSEPLPAHFFAPFIPAGSSQVLEVRKYLERAAYLNFAPAQYKLGHAYEFAQPPFPFDPLLSVQYYSLASQQGEVEADMALSKWFLCGSGGADGEEGGFEKDEALAFTFAEKAAKKGLPSAEFAMGYYAEVGVGSPKDLQTAINWYKLAQSHGNNDAAERLSALSQPLPNALSRQQHDTITESRLVRKRTQAKQRSDTAGHNNSSPDELPPPLPSPQFPAAAPQQGNQSNATGSTNTLYPPQQPQLRQRPDAQRLVETVRRNSMGPNGYSNLQAQPGPQLTPAQQYQQQYQQQMRPSSQPQPQPQPQPHYSPPPQPQQTGRHPVHSATQPQPRPGQGPGVGRRPQSSGVGQGVPSQAPMHRYTLADSPAGGRQSPGPPRGGRTSSPGRPGIARGGRTVSAYGTPPTQSPPVQPLPPQPQGPPVDINSMKSDGEESDDDPSSPVGTPGLGGGVVYAAKPSKGPATFAEMGFQGAKAEDKECVIM